MSEEASAPSAPTGDGQAAPEAPSTPQQEAPSFATMDDLREFVKTKGGRLKLKAGGEEQEVAWDEAERYIPLGKGAYKKFEEAQQLSKAAEQRVAQAESVARFVLESPDEALRRMPPEKREAWLKKIAAGLQEETLPEEKRELLQAKRELDELKRREQERREQEAQAQLSAQEKQYADGFQRAFAGAMDQAGLSKDPTYRRQLMAKMAGVTRRALQNNVQMSVGEVLNIARSEIKQPVREVVRSTSEDELEELLGDERINKLIARRMEKQRAADPMRSAPATRQERQGGQSQSKPVTFDSVTDYSRYLDSLEGKKR